MRNVRILTALGLFAAAGAANAEITGTVTATSDYDFRGSSQTAKDPALQASLDYANESGWYIGVWGSNLDFGPGDPADLEIDVYTGFSGGDEDGLGWDAGIVYYTYPDESDYNYPEIYGILSYGMFSGGLYYSNDWLNLGESAFYVTGDVSVPIPADFSLNLHAGYSFGDWWDEPEPGVPSTDYMDWSIGVGYTIGNFDLELKYVDTTLDRNDYFFGGSDVFNTEGRAIFTVSTTFPWASQ